MLVHQGDFEVKFNECDAKISNCILTFMVSILWLKREYVLTIVMSSGRCPYGNASTPEGRR